MEGLVLRGVSRVRITGGEPLMHPDVVDIVRLAASMPGVDDVALTTNATRLGDLAKPLREAGLKRLNISIDSLDPARFARLTRGGRLEQVLAGIDAAREAGFDDIKTNTVVVGALPGSAAAAAAAVAAAVDPPSSAATSADCANDHELADIVRWAWSGGITPRFLELMTVGEGANLRGRIVGYAAMVHSLGPLLDPRSPAIRPENRGPARYLPAADGSGRAVGFITGSSDTFCDGCDRLRVTSVGALRPCLATTDEVDISASARKGDLEAIALGLDRAWEMKPDGTQWKGCTEGSAADVNMRETGG
ncbi:MAG: hypothetical protein NVSMB1_16260 [Polyangiales bacterium]